MTLAYYGDNYIEIGLTDPFVVTSDITLNGTIRTSREDETLLFLAGKYKFYDKYLTETFGHDGTNNYMRHHLDMRGKSISNATQLSALTYVYTPTIRATNIEFWDVETSGVTDLKN